MDVEHEDTDFECSSRFDWKLVELPTIEYLIQVQIQIHSGPMFTRLTNIISVQI